MSDEYIDISMLEPIWVCPNCGEDTIWTLEDASDNGTPWCRICDGDMEYEGTKLVEGYSIKDFHNTIAKNLLVKALENIKQLKSELDDIKDNAYAKLDWLESQPYIGLDGVSEMSGDGESSVYVPWGFEPYID